MRVRGGEREKDVDVREKHQSVASLTALTWDPTCSLLYRAMPPPSLTARAILLNFKAMSASGALKM